MKGQWRYLYRAVDKQGQTVDFLLSKNRDKATAVRFFKKAIGNNEVPEKITLDGSQASHQAVAELKAEGVLPAQTLVRTNKYLNNSSKEAHSQMSGGADGDLHLHRKLLQPGAPALGLVLSESGGLLASLLSKNGSKRKLWPKGRKGHDC